MFQADREYLFRHAMMCDVAYELQPPTERGKLHWAALQIHRRDDRDRLSPLLPVLLHHVRGALAGGIEGEDLAAANALELDYLVRTADRSRYHLLDKSALELYAQVIASPNATPEQRFLSHHGSGELHRTFGDGDKADAAYRAAERALDEMGAAAEVYLPKLLTGQAGVLMQRRDYDGAEALLQKASPMMLNLGDRAGYAVNRGGLAVVCRRSGRIDKAIALLHEVIAIHQELGAVLGEGNDLSNLANIYVDQGRYDEAEELYRRAVDLVHTAGSRMHEAGHLGNLAGMLERQERNAEARVTYERAINLHREVGNMRGIAVSEGNYGSLLLSDGDWETGQPLLEKALDYMRGIDDPVFRGAFASVLAAHWTLLGEFDRAEAYLQEARDRLPLDRAPIFHLELVAPTEVRLLLATGRSSEAKELLSIAADALARLNLRDNSNTAKRIREAQGALDAEDLVNGFRLGELKPAVRERITSRK